MSFGAIPAEEFSDSDEDEGFIFGSGNYSTSGSMNYNQGSAIANSYMDRNFSSNNQNQGYADQQTAWHSSPGAFGGSQSLQSKRQEGGSFTGPNSKIPTISPQGHKVTIEDFRLALIRGNVESANKCVENGVDVNLKFKTGWTPLMYASHYANTALVSLLLSNGADPNVGTTTALMTCCTCNSKNREEDIESCIRLMIEKGAQVNSADQYGMTPLMMACKKSHLEAVKVLLEFKADVNAKERRGFSPLLWAASVGDLSCIKLLVEAGADVNALTLECQSVLRVAASTKNYTQISHYINSLPQYSRPDHNGSDMNPLPNQPDSLSSSIANQQDLYGASSSSSAFQPDPMAPTTTAAKSTSKQNETEQFVDRMGEVEIFLYGIELSSLIPLFRQHNITIAHLLVVTDDELIKMGVTSVGHRKMILDSVHELHKKEWQDASIPAVEKVKTGKQLNSAEVTSMLASISNHSACMTSSLKYIQTQIENNPSLLQVDKHGRGLHALKLFLHELKNNSDSQKESCILLTSTIQKMTMNGEAETVDEIHDTSTEKSSSNLRFISKAVLVLGVVSLLSYVIYKRH